MNNVTTLDALRTEILELLQGYLSPEWLEKVHMRLSGLTAFADLKAAQALVARITGDLETLTDAIGPSVLPPADQLYQELKARGMRCFVPDGENDPPLSVDAESLRTQYDREVDVLRLLEQRLRDEGLECEPFDLGRHRRSSDLPYIEERIDHLLQRHTEMTLQGVTFATVHSQKGLCE